jgi:hypothetical protein
MVINKKNLKKGQKEKEGKRLCDQMVLLETWRNPTFSRFGHTVRDLKPIFKDFKF